jgi:hypothetical protein
MKITSEVRSGQRAAAVVPEWWAVLPEGEKALLGAVARMLRSAKRSQLQEVARAAAKWERGLGCFIKVRLMNARPKQRAVESRWLRVEGKTPGPEAPGTGRRDAYPTTAVTSCPSGGHSQPSAAPNPS